MPLLAGGDFPPHGDKGFSGFSPTLSGERKIIDVFPKLGVGLEVDDDIGFLAVLIYDESHAFQGSSCRFEPE